MNYTNLNPKRIFEIKYFVKWVSWFIFAVETATFKLLNAPFKCKYNLLKISVGLSLSGLFVTSQFQTPHTHVWESPTVTNKLRHMPNKPTQSSTELIIQYQHLIAENQLKIAKLHRQVIDLQL